MEIPFTVKPRPDTGLWNAKVGIWLFLASEVMLFGGLFSGYLFLRLGAGGEPDYFWPKDILSVEFGFVNTLILILSSVFVVVAWLQLKLRDFRKFQMWMFAVVACALIFLVNKGFEYKSKFTHYGIKLSDNSIVEGYKLDDTIIYEGLKETTIDVARFNGQFLEKIEGETPKFFRVDAEGKTQGEAFELSVEKVQEIAKEENDKLREKHEASNKEKIEKEEVKALSSIVSLLVEAASIDGQIGDDEKNKISSILINQLKLDPIKAKEILDETISLSGDQIEIWSKTSDIRKELDYDERLNILELMWEIVLVDDVLDVFEAQLMRRVSGLLYISDADSGNSKKRALMKLKDNNL